MPRILCIALLFLSQACCLAQKSDQPSDGSKDKIQTIEEMLLFFPSKYPQGNWQPKNLNYQDVKFESADGTQLHGWYCPCANQRAIILLAHGNAGNVASRASWLSYLNSKLKVAVFIFDYRGYGRSEGVPTIDGALEDAKAARTKLRELAQIKDSEMILMGESLGGAIVTQMASESPPRALILQSTFSSLRDVADVHYPKLSWLVSRKRLNSETAISKYQGPLLQSHGSDDRTIPHSCGARLFKAANEPKQLVTIENADHNNWLTDSYLQQLDEFIARIGK